jgi:toxin ParE1/3/4
VSREVRLEPEAIEEIVQAARWYEARDAGLGERFVDAVFLRIEGLGRFSEAGTPIRGVNGVLLARQIRLRSYPYVVIYVTREDVIRVIAIAHERQLPGYWAARSAE